MGQLPKFNTENEDLCPKNLTCPHWFENIPPGLWSSSWTTQSMWRMGRGISFLLFSKQILDFFSYNQILGFLFYFANADIRFLFLHFANSLTQLRYSPHFFTKKKLPKWKMRGILLEIGLCHNGVKILSYTYFVHKNNALSERIAA